MMTMTSLGACFYKAFINPFWPKIVQLFLLSGVKEQVGRNMETWRITASCLKDTIRFKLLLSDFVQDNCSFYKAVLIQQINTVWDNKSTVICPYQRELWYNESRQQIAEEAVNMLIMCS